MRKLIFLLIMFLCLKASGQWTYPQKPMLGRQINYSILNNFVGCWLMNENSGKTIYDLTGNGHNGTFSGNIFWTAGKYGPALSFDGTDDYIVCDDVAIDTTKPFTVCVMCYRAGGAGNFMGLVTTINSTTSTGYAVVHRNTNIFGFLTGDGALSYTMADNTISSNIWYHVVCVYDGATKHIYVDGIKQAATSTVSVSDSNLDLEIGSMYSSSHALDWNGLIDHVIVFDRQLTATEIQQLYVYSYRFILDDNINIWGATLGGTNIPIFMYHYQHH